MRRSSRSSVVGGGQRVTSECALRDAHDGGHEAPRLAQSVAKGAQPRGRETHVARVQAHAAPLNRRSKRSSAPCVLKNSVEPGAGNRVQVETSLHVRKIGKKQEK